MNRIFMCHSCFKTNIHQEPQDVVNKWPTGSSTGSCDGSVEGHQQANEEEEGNS